MRQRFSRFRGRSMARRPGEAARFSLTPGQRRLAGWVAAIGIVAAIAIVVGILGGNADGDPVAPAAGGSASAAAARAIDFGTEIDPATGEVAATAQAARFDPGDTFAYSVRPGTPLPTTIHVEVVRVGEGEPEVVQAIADGAQALPADAEVIAFSVPASALFDAFGPGSYEMRIHLAADGPPVATGQFQLVDPAAPSGTPLPASS